MTARARTGWAVLVLSALLVLAAHLVGARVVPVLTGSMDPVFPRGSLVVTTPLAGADVRAGDVVAFRPPAPYDTGSRPVLHRVTAVSERDGARAMTTRGDANTTADPWTVALDDADLARARWALPLLGWVLAGGTVTAALGVGGVLLLLEARQVAAARHDPPCTCGA
ncbi:signal peptidase I [Kineococcus sp. SYSU DK004]|uniref:signal peptidase I n=1 Tax=Kineococcus sp. SYSU DK004 TaxID=3383125 RepID=UPI003D7D37BF